ncbi:DUF4369 domain-containing protein [Hymenobacter sp. BT18]|uniref:DUF4369 domain-containing protein n=1 Tax=Hymenobacter sp. BT18 TaxID=2835648 RepID=UPI00143E4536|nr:DUF4369 domain-containing protein [Hymenobacter sp. BT18]QIX60566.1 DUF4369 domain-containing protein [Hymenobacter sp. BT18]
MQKYLLALLLAAPGLASAQSATSFTIKGKLGPLSAPAKVYLLRGMTVTDSATIKNGAFELKGTTEAPGMAELIMRRNGRLGSLYGQPGDRTRVYLEANPVLVTSPDSLTHATIAGGH